MVKVPPIKELNKIVQKPNYKTKGTWMARHIVRDAAVPFTWILLHTPITANQITTASIIVIIIAAIFFAQGTPKAFFVGAILLQFWYLIDHIDGQIARYKKQESVTGIFLDYISHYFPHLLIFPSISIGLFHNAPNIGYIYLGISTGAFLTLTNLIFACKYKSFFWGASKYNNYRIKVDYYKLQEVVILNKSKTIFSWVYKFCEIHVIINVLFIFSILSYLPFINFVSIIKFLIIFYAILSPSIFIPKLAYYVMTKKIDKEFFNTFEK